MDRGGKGQAAQVSGCSPVSKSGFFSSVPCSIGEQQSREMPWKTASVRSKCSPINTKDSTVKDELNRTDVTAARTPIDQQHRSAALGSCWVSRLNVFEQNPIAQDWPTPAAKPKLKPVVVQCQRRKRNHVVPWHNRPHRYSHGTFRGPSRWSSHVWVTEVVDETQVPNTPTRTAPRTLRAKTPGRDNRKLATSDHETKKPLDSQGNQGFSLIGPAGFEPTTSTTPR